MHCGPNCRFFLRKSQKIDEMGLCSNPDYINVYELCLSVVGMKCIFYTEIDVETDYVNNISCTKAENECRKFSRQLIYNSVEVVVRSDKQKTSYLGVLLDISPGGVGLLLPKGINQVPEEFYLIREIEHGHKVEFKCICLRSKVHSSFVEIGAAFEEPISEEIISRLFRINPSLLL